MGRSVLIGEHSYPFSHQKKRTKIKKNLKKESSFRNPVRMKALSSQSFVLQLQIPFSLGSPSTRRSKTSNPLYLRFRHLLCYACFLFRFLLQFLLSSCLCVELEIFLVVMCKSWSSNQKLFNLFHLF